MSIEVPESDIHKTIPIEDLGVVILDHPQITISQALIAKLLANNIAIISCDSSHMPIGLFLNLDGHTLQSQKFQAQIQASKPLLKNLWQQTVVAKIRNQASLLNIHDIETGNMQRWLMHVKSGDTSNREATAAVYYWSKLFKQLPDFVRDRFGEPPNNMLNYGYAILRAIVARSLVGSGLLPTLGIHHRNQYNAYCLADDIMEPYRPFVDQLVCTLMQNDEPLFELNTNLKRQLLTIPTLDVLIDQQVSPLMVAVQRTTSSLAKCFQGEQRLILYPQLITPKPN
jgi:CRISPR-associated protein Cas1